MGFSDNIKNVLKNNKKEIETFQLALTSAIGTIIFSECVSNFNQRMSPTRKIFIPELTSVEKILNPENEIMMDIADNLISDICELIDGMKLSNNPQFNIFFVNDHEVLKTILDIYILPNLYKSLIKVIVAKLSLDDPDNRLFIQDPEIKIFKDMNIGNFREVIVMETFLHLINNAEGLNKTVVLLENVDDYAMLIDNTSEFISINNQNMISPIHLNVSLLSESYAEWFIKLTNFVTSTQITMHKIYQNERTLTLTSSPFNAVTVSLVE